MTRAYVFPGQGSQAVGMGQELHTAFPAAREVFGEVDEALKQNLAKLMFEGPADEYAYLEQQYRGYRMLMEQYAGDRQPPHSSKQAYDNFLKSAADLADSAEMHAQATEWDLALEQMQEAVTSYERAMRLIGIGY